jgi:hypothetical protein
MSAQTAAILHHAIKPSATPIGSNALDNAVINSFHSNTALLKNVMTTSQTHHLMVQ